MDEQLAALADRYWTWMLETNPTSATLLGYHEHDAEVEDLSLAGQEQQRAAAAALRDAVTAIDGEHFDTQDRVTRGLLESELDNVLDSLGGADGSDVPHLELACDQLRGPHVPLLTYMPQVTLPEPEHAWAIVERLQRVGTPLEQALERFRAATASGLTHARRPLEAVIRQLDGYLDSDLDEDPCLKMQPPPDWAEVDPWRQRVREVVRDEVRPALRRFRDGVAGDLLPHARDDDRPGLCWLDGGARLYARYVRYHTSLELDPQEIHQLGRQALRQLDEEYAQVAGRVLDTDDPARARSLMRSDDSLSYGSGDEMLTHAKAAVERASAALPDWFGRVPRADCVVVPVPDFLAGTAPPAFYFPPADDGSRPGTYFLNTQDHSALHRFEGEATAFHEALPGHHLQIAIATELEGLPDFRRHVHATAYVEGWGLYSERLADEMGLYGTQLDRLGILALDSFRAARLVVDTGLHAYGWTREQAVEFMRDWTPLPERSVQSEVDRYIAVPAQALAYKVGQREIRRLRAMAEERLGADFDVRDFHDVLLTSGAVTLPILRELVDQWVTGRSVP